MSSKHTPAPWFTKREGFSTVYIEARIGRGMLQEVAACGPTSNGTDEQEANARLIAAAPELLEALKDVCQAYAWLTFGECRGWSESEPLTMQEALDKAETLITKAEGKQA